MPAKDASMLDARLIDLARRWKGWSKAELNRRLGLPANDKSLCHALPLVRGKPHGVAWRDVHRVMGVPLLTLHSYEVNRELIDAAHARLQPGHSFAELEAVMREICPALLDALHRRV